MLVGVYSINAFMNKKHRERKKKQAEHKAEAAKPEVPFTGSESDQEEHREQCCLGEKKPEALHPISRWLRFKKWLYRITPAELVTAFLTGVIAVATIRYSNISEKQWNTMQRQLDDIEASTSAYLFVEDFNPTLTMGTPGQGMIIKGTFTVTNVGNTVAREIYFQDTHWSSYRLPGPRGDSTPPPDKASGIPGIVSESSTSFSTHYPLLAVGKSLDYPVGRQDGSWDKVELGKWFVGDFIDVSYQTIYKKTVSFQDCFVYDYMVKKFSRCPTGVATENRLLPKPTH